MKVLVTGAAGFIGSHLVSRLIEGTGRDLSAQVIGVDNFNNFYDPEIKRKNYAEHLQSKFYKIYEMDLCDYGALKKVFDENEITHVVHLAALAGVRPSVENPVLYNTVNNGSTINILDLISKQPKHSIKKFVFGSSSSVYGSRSKVPFKETEDVSKPISPYAATKVSGEAMSYTMHYLYKIPTICLRFFTVYGPRQRPDLAIHKFTKLISEGKEIPVYGDGSVKRDFTYIDDIVDGIIKSLSYKCDFEIFNLGESRTVELKTLISLLESKLNKKAKINYLDPIPGDVPITYADITKAKNELGYNPSIQIEEGLDKFIEWFVNSCKK